MSKHWSPHSYQITAMNFLLRKPRSGLFLDPGLGKTSIALSTIKILKNIDKCKGALIIAPLRVIYDVWPDEIEKWSNFNNISYSILHQDRNDLWRDKDIHLINPEGLDWLYYELLEGLKFGEDLPFNNLWIDESTKFKNPLSKRFGLLKDMLPIFKRRYVMTGTPAPRGLLDLWPQIFILDEGKALSANYYHYRNKYFEANDYKKYDWKVKDFSDIQIHKAVAPLVLEMKSEDYLSMPKLLFNNIKINLPPKAMKYYKKMEKELFIQLDSMEATAKAAAQASGKCHQIANGRVYEDIPENISDDELRVFKRNRKTLNIHSAKIEALEDLIAELRGKPVLIAYNFKHDLEQLQGLLGKDVPNIGSGTKPNLVKKYKEMWNRGELPYLLVNPASMSHGLNLQEGGHDLIWFSLVWNLEFYIQLYKRLYRQGVKKTVRVHHLIASSTVDEAIVYRLGERSKQQIDLREAIKRYRRSLT